MFDPKTRILVCDDMLTMRKLVTKALKDLGFTDFIEAADGKLGWDALTAANPPVQLVVSDWNMPNMSGLEFLKKVRSTDPYKKLPFVLLTAEAEKNQILEAIQSGVSNYIVKPFTVDMLKQKLSDTHKRVSAAPAA